jgi:hypothetical protein
VAAAAAVLGSGRGATCRGGAGECGNGSGSAGFGPRRHLQGRCRRVRQRQRQCWVRAAAPPGERVHEVGRVQRAPRPLGCGTGAELPLRRRRRLADRSVEASGLQHPPRAHHGRRLRLGLGCPSLRSRPHRDEVPHASGRAGLVCAELLRRTNRFYILYPIFYLLYSILDSRF